MSASHSVDPDNMDMDGPRNVIEHILTVKTLPLKRWKELSVLPRYNTTQLTLGSVWRIDDDDDDENEEEGGENESGNKDNARITKFLVKWKGLSYLQTSWELEVDIREACAASFATALARFQSELEKTGHQLFSDLQPGEYFPPEYLQVERVLDIVQANEDLDHIKAVPVRGIHGTNCSLTIKWRGLPYSMCTFEEVSDLQNIGIPYIAALKEFKNREAKIKSKATAKPTAPLTFKHGQRLYDYQRYGVNCLVRRMLDGRHTILADEDGLGKYTQLIASTWIAMQSTEVNNPSVLFIVPAGRVDSLAMAYEAWTGIQPVKYYGTNDSLKVAFSHEFCYVDTLATVSRAGAAKAAKVAKVAKGANPLRPIACKSEVVIATLESSKQLRGMKWLVACLDEEYTRLISVGSKVQTHMNCFLSVGAWVACMSLPTVEVNQNDAAMELSSSGHTKKAEKKLLPPFPVFNFVNREHYGSVEALDAYLKQAHVLQTATKAAVKLHAGAELRIPSVIWRTRRDVGMMDVGRQSTGLTVETLPVAMTPEQCLQYMGIFLDHQRWMETLRSNQTAHRDFIQVKRSLSPLSAADVTRIIVVNDQLRRCCLDARPTTNGQLGTNRNQAMQLERLLATSGKIKYLHEHLLPRIASRDTITNVVVFSQFRTALETLETYFTLAARCSDLVQSHSVVNEHPLSLSGVRISVARADWSMPPEEYFNVLDRFAHPQSDGAASNMTTGNSKSNLRVLLVGIKHDCRGSGTFGMSPVMDITKHVVCYDGMLDIDGYNDVYLQQHFLNCSALDGRAPAEPVTLYRLVCQHSIEEEFMHMARDHHRWMDRSGALDLAAIHSRPKVLQQLLPATIGTFGDAVDLGASSANTASYFESKCIQLNLGWPRLPEELEKFMRRCVIRALRLAANSAEIADHSGESIICKDGFWKDCLSQLRHHHTTLAFSITAKMDRTRAFSAHINSQRCFPGHSSHLKPTSHVSKYPSSVATHDPSSIDLFDQQPNEAIEINRLVSPPQNWAGLVWTKSMRDGLLWALANHGLLSWDLVRTQSGLVQFAPGEVAMLSAQLMSAIFLPFFTTSDPSMWSLLHHHLFSMSSSGNNGYQQFSSPSPRPPLQVTYNFEQAKMKEVVADRVASLCNASFALRLLVVVGFAQANESAVGDDSMATQCLRLYLDLPENSNSPTQSMKKQRRVRDSDIIVINLCKFLHTLTAHYAFPTMVGQFVDDLLLAQNPLVLRHPVLMEAAFLAPFVETPLPLLQLFDRLDTLCQASLLCSLSKNALKDILCMCFPQLSAGRLLFPSVHLSGTSQDTWIVYAAADMGWPRRALGIDRGILNWCHHNLWCATCDYGAAGNHRQTPADLLTRLHTIVRCVGKHCFLSNLQSGAPVGLTSSTLEYPILSLLMRYGRPHNAFVNLNEPVAKFGIDQFVIDGAPTELTLAALRETLAGLFGIENRVHNGNVPRLGLDYVFSSDIHFNKQDIADRIRQIDLIRLFVGRQRELPPEVYAFLHLRHEMHQLWTCEHFVRLLRAVLSFGWGSWGQICAELDVCLCSSVELRKVQQVSKPIVTAQQLHGALVSFCEMAVEPSLQLPTVDDEPEAEIKCSSRDISNQEGMLPSPLSSPLQEQQIDGNRSEQITRLVDFLVSLMQSDNASINENWALMTIASLQNMNLTSDEVVRFRAAETISELCQHRNLEIADAAKKLRLHWKQNVACVLTAKTPSE